MYCDTQSLLYPYILEQSFGQKEKQEFPGSRAAQFLILLRTFFTEENYVKALDFLGKVFSR
ncbi:MAG: hypothetical protein KF862_14810 [Chitinophagaceae bacterium]|nr:hypothetical protein [Chitinophagaceae bacterium]